MIPIITFEKLHPFAQIPKPALDNAAGLDVSCLMLTEQSNELTWRIPARDTRTFPTGLLVAPPVDHAVLVLSRSGLACKGVFVANAPGLIDPDYRGELQIILYNGSSDSFPIKSGWRIAQLLLLPVVRCQGVEGKVDTRETPRGASGFGSTGLGRVGVLGQ